VALLEAFRRAMSDLGITGRLLAADVTVASAAFHRADEGILVPPVGDAGYIPALADLCDRKGVGLMIPLTDLDLLTLAEHRETFAAAGCEVMIASPEAIADCMDKSRTAGLLRGIGLEAVRTVTLQQFRAEPFYPCFIKPTHGSAGIGARLLRSAADMNAHLDAYGERMLVQEVLPGPEYTLDVFRSRTGQVRCVVPRQRLSVRAGEVEKGLTVHDEELISCGVRLGEALEGLWGVVNAQCRRVPGGRPQFFEINPRFGGGAPLAIAAGADLPRYVLEERLGLPCSAELGRFTPNLLMLRYDEAVFVQVDDPSGLGGFDTPLVR